MAVRSITFEAPLTPVSRVSLRDGRVASVASVAAMAPAEREDLVEDPALRAQIERVADGEVALPGADRWRRRVEQARPAAPVWVPALERNCRVIEVELARDALADPWNPARFVSMGDSDLTVLGAASMSWRKGDIGFDVRQLRPGSVEAGMPAFDVVRYSLRDKDRRRLWEHLTGVLRSMEIESGQVTTSTDQSDSAWPKDRTPEATIGLVGIAVPAAYMYTDERAQAARIREDGSLRLDQLERTGIAEAHADLLRRHATAGGVPTVYGLRPVSDYDLVGGCDDLGQGVRNTGRTLLAVGVGAAATVGGVVASQSATVRRWFSSGWSKVAALGDGL